MGNSEIECEVYLNNLKAFIEFNNHPIDQIKLVTIPNDKIHLWNSGLYIVKIINNLILGIDLYSKIQDVNDYRIEIFIILLELSKIN